MPSLPLLDTAKLQELLEARKWDEAKELLEASFSAPLTQEERGAASAAVISLYVQLMNRINRRYAAALDDAMAVLKDLNTHEGRALNEVDVARVRNQIKGGASS